MKYSKEQIEAMTPEQLKRAVATDVMGLKIYSYDKDIEANCYVMLVDENFDPVARFDGLSTGERKTEEEAWADCPDYINDLNSVFAVIEELKKLYGIDIYIQKGFDPKVTLFTWYREYEPHNGKTLGEAVGKAALAVME